MKFIITTSAWFTILASLILMALDKFNFADTLLIIIICAIAMIAYTPKGGDAKYTQNTQNDD